VIDALAKSTSDVDARVRKWSVVSLGQIGPSAGAAAAPYLGFARLRSLLEETPRPVELIPFPLNPSAAKEGQALEPYMRAKGIPTAAVSRLADMCEADGLSYPRSVEGRFVWNTERAQELALWAAGHLEPAQMLELHTTLFAAYHVENRNLYDLEVLVDIASEFGLEEDDVRAALTGEEFARRRRNHWSTAMEAGVRGVPTFVSKGRAVVGAQPRETLASFLALPD
jgi:predicted DsbA family dithiol-disulfide isomerase